MRFRTLSCEDRTKMFMCVNKHNKYIKCMAIFGGVLVIQNAQQVERKDKCAFHSVFVVHLDAVWGVERQLQQKREKKKRLS